MPELIPTASEAEWLEARRRGITASEIAVIMGLSPYSSPYALYHQKLGILPPPDDSAVMERGRVLEPYIADKFGSLHPNELVALGDGRELYAHSERRWQMATPDRLVFPWMGPFTAPRAVLECKVDGGSDEWGEPGTDEIPVHYRCQVLWQCDVMGAGRWYLACLRVRDWKVLFYTGEIDEDAERDLALMRTAARDFLDRIDLKEVPDVDWRPATAAALRALYPDEDGGDIAVRPALAISYRAAVRRYQAAERRKDQMTAAVLEVLRNDRRAIDPRTGDPIATRSVSRPKRISSSMVRERYPDIAAECTKPPKPEVKLTPARPKKEKKS